MLSYVLVACHPGHDDDALLFLLDGCVCIGVKYLQDGFTEIQTHQCSEHKLRDFRTPYLKMTNEHTWVLPIALLCKSNLNHFCKVAQSGVLSYARWSSLSRGFWNRAIYARYMETHAMTWRRCVAFFLDGCVCIEVKYLQDGFTNLQTHAMTWRRCVAFFFWMDALYRGKIFARWVYRNTNDMTTMRCFFLLNGCVCIGVKYLQDGFT